MEENTHIFVILYDKIMKCISNCVAAYELDRKACGLILLMIYVFTSYSMVTSVHRMLTGQVGFEEVACGCSIVALFTLITYIYGTVFGIFTYDLPYNVDTNESHEDAEKQESEGSSTPTENDPNNSETSKEADLEGLQKLLEDVSKENDERIQKAVLSNQKRIELLTQNIDVYVRNLVEHDERLRESYSLETDKYVKISTAEIDENLKWKVAFNEQHVRLTTAAEGKNARRDLVDYIHKKRQDFLKSQQTIELQFTADYEKLQTANLNRFKHFHSKAFEMDK
ncbi:hypothetical protein TNIN_95721 [Trichonephila inaurata madagascariensis]|uniref:Uncharacterized protein n=1 Tax=Trichonephila inaurata madagascariensis TaxID=2747483 RepID=A0A8X6X7B1_9ARAC|nr:hypothetical protein TNIN_95721 [Trichonephila inaurata madagascariensis]